MFGIGAAVSANWVLTMPSDLSEIDVQGNKLPNPYGWQFRLFLILLCPICLVFAKHTAAKSGTIALTSSLVALTWFLDRGFSARADGANMTGVGLVFFGPLFFGSSTLGVLIVRRRQSW